MYKIDKDKMLDFFQSNNEVKFFYTCCDIVNAGKERYGIKKVEFYTPKENNPDFEYVEFIDNIFNMLFVSINTTSKSIEKILARNNITYETVAISTNPLMAGMDEHWQAYDLTDENGKVYILILRKEDFDFTAVLENDGTLIEGLIDNGVTPLLFTDRID